jgi:hypothetical protein
MPNPILKKQDVKVCMRRIGRGVVRSGGGGLHH